MLWFGHWLRFSFLAGILLAALGGCKGDNCEELPAQAQIEVVLEGLSVKDLASSFVELTINNAKVLAHHFNTPAPSFVFEFEEYDRPPRTLAISATVSDQEGNTLGTGYLETTFSSDGCNFFRVTVAPVVLSDAGQDGEVPDAAPPDTSVLDLPVDTMLDLPPDQTVDLPPDTTVDTTLDLPQDQTVDLPPDTTVDVPQDQTVDLPQDQAVSDVPMPDA